MSEDKRVDLFVGALPTESEAKLHSKVKALELEAANHRAQHAEDVAEIRDLKAQNARLIESLTKRDSAS
ncbi:MAG TPA: hypothetical protein VGM99_05400 [Candidatus Cybelea sp.]